MSSGYPMNSRRIKLFLALGLAVLLSARLLLQFILYRSGFTCLTADEFARTIMSAHWARHPQLICHGVWLPFHQYFLGFLLRLKWELLWTPRIAWMAMGALSIVLIYFFSRRLFRSRSVGLISAILLASNPLHIWLSSTPLSELPYLTAILAFLLSFTLYLRRDKIIYLYLSAFLLIAGNGFRYESWLLTMVFSLYTAVEGIRRFRHVNKGRLLTSLAAALLPWIVPLLWLVGNYEQSGSALYFLEFNRILDLSAFGSRRSYLNLFGALFRIDPVTSILGVVGLGAALIRFRHDRAVHYYVAASVIPFILFFLLQGGRATLPGNYLRYLASFVFFIYPALAYFLVMVIDYLSRASRPRLIILALIVGLLASARIRASFLFDNDPAGAGLKVGEKIRLLRNGDFSISSRPVLIEASSWEHLAIEVGANDVTSLLMDRKIIDEARDRRTPSLLLADKETMMDFLTGRGVSYVVVKSPELKQAMEKDLELESRGEANGYIFYLIPPDFDKTEGVENKVLR